MGEHANIAAKSSISAIKSLRNRALVVKELRYKLRENIQNRTLMPLPVYLKLDEVKDFGITEYDVGHYVTPSSIILV